MRLDSLINVITDYARRLGAIAGYGYRQQESEFFEAHGDEGVAVFVSPDVTLPAYPGYYGYRIAAEGADGGQMLDRLRFLLRTDCDIRYDREITYGGGVWAYSVSLHLKAKKYGLGGGGSAVPDALNFTMPNGGTITLTKSGSPTEVALEYTTDRVTWATWEETSNVRTITLNAGETVYIRNTSETSTGFSTGDDGPITNYYYFSFTGDTYADGPLESLICKRAANAEYIGRATFRCLFYGQSNLKQAPKITATSIMRRSLQQTFDGTGIEEAPELLFDTVPSYGCYRMFRYCSSLKLVKVHFTSLSSSSPLTQWLDGVAASGDFYCPQNLTIPTGSSGIPSGWTRHDL